LKEVNEMLIDGLFAWAYCAGPILEGAIQLAQKYYIIHGEPIELEAVLEGMYEVYVDDGDVLGVAVVGSLLDLLWG
jgi:hypothetical protein